MRSPVVKFNAALDELPNWAAADGETWPARAMIELTDGIDSAQAAFERCVAGEPAVGFAEVYTQTGFDPSPAPAGKHSMTVFGQYAPYAMSDGDWDSRRDEVARQFIDLIDRFAPGIEDRLIDYEVLGPPDIESRIGLTGGQIFQGSVLPEQMWENRLAAADADPGLLPLRRRDPPRRQRHRHERPQRRRRGPRRRLSVGYSSSRRHRLRAVRVERPQRLARHLERVRGLGRSADDEPELIGVGVVERLADRLGLDEQGVRAGSRVSRSPSTRIRPVPSSTT